MSRNASQIVQIEPRAGVTACTKQRFAPSAIQGLEVLSLPVTRLDAYARALVERNPLLDFDYDRASLQFEELPDEDEDSDTNDRYDDRPIPQHPQEARMQGFDMARLRDERCETETLHSHLRMQLGTLYVKEDDRALLDALIESIDDDGYFSGSMSALCAEAGRCVDEGQRMLRVIQGFTPCGVGARTLAECLMLQLDDNAPHAAIVRAMVRDHLEDLAANRTTKLMRAYKLTVDDLAEVREAISKLNPRPGASYSQYKDTVYVIPDLVISLEGARFSVRVTGELSETIVFNSLYCDLLSAEQTIEEVREWIDERKAEADAALANIDQRKQTLYRFGAYLAETQYDFFCGGESRMRPLTMQQAADALDVHVSTISRTVQDKHVLTPWGVYPLKHFFSSAVTCSTEEQHSVLSSLAIKDRIRDLIVHEDSRRPMSDATITSLLNNEGIDIKRRTVAKYRMALGIENQSQRRR